MKYFLIAGESSGDNLGALLIDAIKQLDNESTFRFWGGDNMQVSSGISPLQHIDGLAFMGFVEVIKNLKTILNLIRKAKNDISLFKPDVLICIDYPGFNLRLAKWAKSKGIRVEFYVSPQIWAWRQSRVHKIIRDTDRVLSILPFEQAFYNKYGYDVAYVGHPLPKRIDDHKAPQVLSVQTAQGTKVIEGQILALLPGSRSQEIERLLPIMLSACQALSSLTKQQIQPVLAAAPALKESTLRSISTTYDIAWHRNSYDVLAHAHLACVASGTATLETALFNVPQVVCYKGSTLSVAIARKLIKVDYIALVNLILNEAVVPELIQDKLTDKSLSSALEKLNKGEHRESQLLKYDRLRQQLKPYNSAHCAAKKIVISLNNNE